MLMGFESMSDGHLRPISVSKKRTDLINDKVRPVHTTLYRAGSIAKQFGAAEINPVFAERIAKQATAE